MAGQHTLQSPQCNRRQPLLDGNKDSLSTPTTVATTPTPPMKVGQVAGRTAADIFVVCCCCPCGMAECLILAVFRFPASVVRRMWRKQKNKLMVKVKQRRMKKCNCSGAQQGVGYGDDGVSSDVELKEFDNVKDSAIGSASAAAAVELDREMWERFHNSGFWRSPSQRHTS